MANMRTIAHKGSSGVAICSAPDVCKTPPQPLPIPYVNVAYSRDLQQGSRTVKADGMPIALKNSYFLPSFGDEPGTAGGVVSGVNKGKAKFANYSQDVKIEGRNVARLADPMTMNGNAPNTNTAAEQQPNMDPELHDILCRIFCWCNAGKKGSDFVKRVPGGPDLRA